MRQSTHPDSIFRPIRPRNYQELNFFCQFSSNKRASAAHRHVMFISTSPGKFMVMSYAIGNTPPRLRTASNLCRDMMVANASVTESIAKFAPMHIRGPAPKGTHANLWRVSSNLGWKRSGSNRSGSSQMASERPIAYADMNTTSLGSILWPVGRTSSLAATRGKMGMGGYRRSTSLRTCSQYTKSFMSAYVGRRALVPVPSTRSNSSTNLASTSGCWLTEYSAAVRVLAVVSWPAPMTSCTSSQSSASDKGGSPRLLFSSCASSSTSSRSPLRAPSFPATICSRRSLITGITATRMSSNASSMSTINGTLNLLMSFKIGSGVMNTLPIMSCATLISCRMRSVGIWFSPALAPIRSMASI
mmetsp:Transcript_10255/g.19381  ORF Transcript_10255/g.19381 Transcript_10255/m.19381 type:complete len:359 (-) Transcript_10255:998-2074(-)